MSAKNTRRGLFDDQSATPLSKQEKQMNMKMAQKQKKEMGMKPVSCDTDEDCMKKNPKNGGDGGY